MVAFLVGVVVGAVAWHFRDKLKEWAKALWAKVRGS